jgi:hypothetical protein
VNAVSSQRPVSDVAGDGNEIHFSLRHVIFSRAAQHGFCSSIICRLLRDSILLLGPALLLPVEQLPPECACSGSL